VTVSADSNKFKPGNRQVSTIKIPEKKGRNCSQAVAGIAVFSPDCSRRLRFLNVLHRCALVPAGLLT